MFHSARLQLTACYLVIIMLISVAFSFTIYRVLMAELDRVERLQRVRIELHTIEGSELAPDMLPPPARMGVARPVIIDPAIMADTKRRLIIFLAGINVSILLTSGAAGYFLAGLTLQPIALMVANQKRFVSDASHELRTPLTAMKAETEVNLRDPHLTLTAAKQLLSSNIEEIDRLQLLTDNLLQLTQLENDHTLPKTVIALSKLWPPAQKSVAKVAQAKAVTLHFTKTNARVLGNASLLTELLVILLDNAIKYSPTGTTVELTSRVTDGHVRIEVADQGCGISAADLPHIFDRFYRSDLARSKNDAFGYGLGLAIAQQIVELHKGTINAFSEPGKGTRFVVQLPVVSREV
jgi:two-component system, OmpR family, sensor histidine kinase CiaH